MRGAKPLPRIFVFIRRYNIERNEPLDKYYSLIINGGDILHPLLIWLIAYVMFLPTCKSFYLSTGEATPGQTKLSVTLRKKLLISLAG